jgi:predicted DNA-binding transcriptional regulator AlpA
MTIPVRVLRPHQTVDKVNVCDRQLREWEAEGRFPKRFKLHPDGRAVGHFEHEIDQWLIERAASREVVA